MRPVWLFLIGLVAAAGACKRAKPSNEYTEAAGLHSTLVARLGDAAYADDEMSRVEGLLDKVPADSTDAAAAAELKRLIGSERKRIEDERLAHEREMESLLDAPTTTDSPRAVDPPPEAPTADTDAGSSYLELTPGMSVDDLKKVSGDCFASTGPIKLRRPDKTEVDGELFERRDTGTCRERFEHYAGRVLVFRDGKLAANYDKAEVRNEPGAKPQVPTAPPPGTPAPGAGTPAAPAPQPFYPGAPVPGAAPVSPGENTGAPPTSPGDQTGPAPAP